MLNEREVKIKKVCCTNFHRFGVYTGMKPQGLIAEQGVVHHKLNLMFSIKLQPKRADSAFFKTKQRGQKLLPGEA